MAGPLAGITIVEFSGLGPGPFCGMMLADHGADVIRIDRIGGFAFPGGVLDRSKRSVSINMKKPEGIEIARALCAKADGVVEGFRPGVMERLGLGPEILLKDNPDLVYGRMTGWGQTGPLAPAAGHDINYIAISGALHTCGRRGEGPTPPVNYVGDFGGGGMMLAFGMAAALVAVRNGAGGQVIDCAMTDGSAILTAMTWSLMNAGAWRDETGVNQLDSGAHYYDVYETKDGKFLSVGAIEPQFYALLREKAGLADAAFDAQMDEAAWPALKERLGAVIRAKTRDEWSAIMAGTDACVAPVLSLKEAARHPHNIARQIFVEVAGATHPAPAPRYSATRTAAPKPMRDDSDAILTGAGKSVAEIAALRAAGVVG